MERKHLGVVFLTNLLFFGTGSGLGPLLPVYALGLGASPAVAGLCLAGVFAALAAGTLLAHRLASIAGGYRRLYLAAAILHPPLVALLGLAGDVRQLAALVAAQSFCVGLLGALATILADLAVGPARRGRAFALLGLAMPAGGTLGTLAIGATVDRLGYPAMFALLGLAWLSLPPLAAHLPRDAAPTTMRADHASGAKGAPALGPAFGALLGATFLAATAIALGRLGTSFGMGALGFGPGTITRASALGALAAAPLLPLAGVLSDRLGRRGVLLAAHLAAAAGALALVGATRPWQFGLATALLSATFYANGSVDAALASDLLPVAARARGLSLLGAASWVAAIGGYGGGGWLLGVAGPRALQGLAAALAVGAAALLAAFQTRRSPVAPRPSGTPSPIERAAIGSTSTK